MKKNDTFLLKATTKLNSPLKGLEVKLPIWLGKGQILEPREAGVISSAQVCLICCGVQSVLSSPLWLALSSQRLGQIIDYLGFTAGVGPWKEQEGLGSSSYFITISSNFSPPQNRIILLSISQGYFRN